MNEYGSSFPGGYFWCGEKEKPRWPWAHGLSTSTLLCSTISDQNNQIIMPWIQITINGSPCPLFYRRSLEAEIQQFPQSGPRLFQESVCSMPYLAFWLGSYFIPFMVVPLSSIGSGTGSPNPLCISGIWGEICSGLLGKRNFFFYVLDASGSHFTAMRMAAMRTAWTEKTETDMEPWSHCFWSSPAFGPPVCDTFYSLIQSETFFNYLQLRES